MKTTPKGNRYTLSAPRAWLANYETLTQRAKGYAITALDPRPSPGWAAALHDAVDGENNARLKARIVKRLQSVDPSTGYDPSADKTCGCGCGFRGNTGVFFGARMTGRTWVRGDVQAIVDHYNARLTARMQRDNPCRVDGERIAKDGVSEFHIIYPKPQALTSVCRNK
jgi:hypothetical protein